MDKVTKAKNEAREREIASLRKANETYALEIIDMAKQIQSHGHTLSIKESQIHGLVSSLEAERQKNNRLFTMLERVLMIKD